MWGHRAPPISRRPSPPTPSASSKAGCTATRCPPSPPTTHRQPGHRIPRFGGMAADRAARAHRRQRLVPRRQRRQLPPAGRRDELQLLVQRDILRDRHRIHVPVAPRTTSPGSRTSSITLADARDLLRTRRGPLPGPAGHLILETYNGASGPRTPSTPPPTCGRILASGDAHHQRHRWTVYVDGGLTASFSGTARA